MIAGYSPLLPLTSPSLREWGILGRNVSSAPRDNWGMLCTKDCEINAADGVLAATVLPQQDVIFPAILLKVQVTALGQCS